MPPQTIRGKGSVVGNSSEGRRRHALRKFGLTEDSYDTLFIQQEGVCAICQREPKRRQLAVDHDHGSGKVRGLLCTRCNLLLGMVDDDVMTLRTAVTYLLRE